jgi:hypothetical protein
MEIWRVVTSNDNYLVSNLGKIRHKKKKKALVPVYDKDGYQTVKLYRNGKYKTVKVHRIVVFEFCKGYDETKEVDHINRIRNDNRADNLQWLTHAQNNARKAEHGK